MRKVLNGREKNEWSRMFTSTCNFESPLELRVHEFELRMARMSLVSPDSSVAQEKQEHRELELSRVESCPREEQGSLEDNDDEP